MYDDDSLTYDALEASYGSVGPQNDGTYDIPLSAQPVNQPWDSGGGTRGDYSGALDVLRLGIGAWSQNKRNNQFLDYQRYEATAGGVYAQGRPNPQAVQGQATVSAFGNPTMLLVMGLGLILLLRK